MKENHSTLTWVKGGTFDGDCLFGLEGTDVATGAAGGGE